MVWGVGIGLAVTLFLSDVPLFQRDVLKKIPAVSAIRGGLSYGRPLILDFCLTLASMSLLPPSLGIVSFAVRFHHTLCNDCHPQVKQYYNGQLSQACDGALLIT